MSHENRSDDDPMLSQKRSEHFNAILRDFKQKQDAAFETARQSPDISKIASVIFLGTLITWAGITRIVSPIDSEKLFLLFQAVLLISGPIAIGKWLRFRISRWFAYLSLLRTISRTTNGISIVVISLSLVTLVLFWTVGTKFRQERKPNLNHSALMDSDRN
jgi:hypothetical protein